MFAGVIRRSPDAPAVLEGLVKAISHPDGAWPRPGGHGERTTEWLSLSKWLMMDGCDTNQWMMDGQMLMRMCRGPRVGTRTPHTTTHPERGERGGGGEGTSSACCWSSRLASRCGPSGDSVCFAIWERRPPKLCHTTTERPRGTRVERGARVQRRVSLSVCGAACAGKGDARRRGDEKR